MRTLRLLSMLIFFMIGCSTKNPQLTVVETSNGLSDTELRVLDDKLNKWNYYGKFEIQLPKGWSLSSSIINKDDSIKVGEVVLDHELLKSQISGSEYFEINKTGGDIITVDTNYSTECEECILLKADSIIIAGKTWYFDINQNVYEGADDWGYWNCFSYANIENNRITIINFYNKDLKDMNRESYETILSSIQFK